MTLLDEKPVVLEELDIAVPCDRECDAEATWSWRWTCGCVDLLCDVHDRKMQEFMVPDPGAILTRFHCKLHDVRCDVTARLSLKGGAS